MHVLMASDADTADAEISAGLLSTPKYLPSRLGYDEIGSSIYVEMNSIPEYYPIEAEKRLFAAHRAEVLARAASSLLVELGAGTAVKTDVLLENLSSRPGARFIGIDVSRSALEEAERRLGRTLPDLEVVTVQADFHTGLGWLSDHGPDERALVGIFGGTYGNMSADARIALTRRIRDAVAPRGGTFAVCVDLHKTDGSIERAYDVKDRHAAVRQEFYLNRLDHLNRAWGARLDRDGFEVDSYYLAGEYRMQVVLRSRRRQDVDVPALGVRTSLAPGEEIVADVMQKFTHDSLCAELDAGGWAYDSSFVDGPTQYALYLFRCPPAR